MKYSTNLFRLVVISVWFFLIIGVFFVIKNDEKGSIRGESNVWVQTDWSGGQNGNLVTDTVDTYLSKTNINTSDPGAITLDFTNGWSNSLINWKYRQKIVFNNTESNLGVIPEVLENFPLLVKLDSSKIDYGLIDSFGKDIRLTDKNGMLLSYEIELWNNAGSSFIWVKVPEINVGDTDYIYLYYGNNSAVDAQNQTDVWSDNYSGVWHFKEPVHNMCVGGTKDVCDSTTNGNDGLWMGSYKSVIGKIGLAGQQTRGGGTYVDFGDPSVFDFGSNDFTIETWAYRNNLVSDWDNSIIGKWNTGSFPSTNEWSLSFGSGGPRAVSPGFTVVSSSISYSANSPDNLSLNTWQHIVGVREKTNMKLYVNGVLKATTPVGGITINNIVGRTVKVAKIDAGSFGFDGSVDEVRISSKARSNAWLAASYKADSDLFTTFSARENTYPNAGTLESNIFDALVAMDWDKLAYNKIGNGSVLVKVRSGNNNNLSDASGWSSCNNISNGEDLSNGNCVTNSHRYVQYQVTLQPSGGQAPVFEDISLTFAPSDTVPPDNNGSNLRITGLSQSGDWYGKKPLISWTSGSDDNDGSGLLGYCIALDEAELNDSNLLDPSLTAGKLNNIDDGVLQSFCKYIVRNTEIDLNSITGLTLVSGKQYYFSIKAVDLSGNIYTGNENSWQDLISFKYDNTPPNPPFYISLPANFMSSKDVVITWPVGVGGANDLQSGLAGLQYKIGENGIWYGDLHTGTEDINDVLINDGSYTTNPDFDYARLQEGNNLIYFRAVDNVGNVTSPSNYVKGLLKLNTVAPSPVRNLTVSPVSSEVNKYSFSWNSPDMFTGSESGLSYCYSVNALPSINTCTFTSPGITSLVADSFATQPGENTLYVVARDEAFNINYATYNEPGSSVTFTYSGSAPGIVHNLDIADISVKATQNWRLVLSWDVPENIGAGIAYFNIYRGENGAMCNSDFSSFKKVGSSTSTSYIDPNLSQKVYSYCVKACDSANNCSASSGTVSKMPTGKFTEPAKLLSPPEVTSFTTKKAVINWMTDRVSDSSVEYGLKSGEYFEAEISNSNQVAMHTIPLNNLEPGTSYFYRVKWTDIDGNTGVSEEKTFATMPAPTVSNTTVSSITTNSATITFTVSNAMRANILYGLTENYGGSEITATSLSESTYMVILRNLVEGSTYNFKFNLTDIDGNEYNYFENHQFKTVPFPRVKDIQIEEIKNTAQPTVGLYWLSNVPITTQVLFYPLDNQDAKRTQLDTEFATEHKLEISELFANTKYGLAVSGRDILGNEVISDEYQFTTSADSRPPEVSKIKIDTRLNTVSQGDSSQAQLIISWNTDEGATSQVEFGEGSSGAYTQKTLVDDNLTFNHLVVINNLRPSSVYHLRVISKDEAGNETGGRNIVTITAQTTENPLDIIISRLTSAFSFLK